MADRIKGITIKIGGDTTGLNKALGEVNKEIRNTQSQLKDVERLLKLDPSNTELLRQKQKLLADAVGETKTKLDTLKEAEKQAQGQFKEGKISEEQYNALKREIVATEQQLEKLEGQAKNSNVALQKIGQAGEKVQEFGGKVSSAGRELSKVSAGLAAVGGASVAAWKTVDEAYDQIAKGTGATGEALEGLQKSFDNVYSSIPAEAAAAGNAIADINTRFGFTGNALEDCTKRFLQFAEVNNTDVSTAIANVSRYMGDAGIESSKYGEVLDQLTAASQASGISIDKLTDHLTKYGAPMRALGFDTQESIAIFAGWEKAGVNTETAFSGMKTAIGKWSKQGKDARKEFKKTLDEIAACPDIASATGKAIEAFGQKAGPDLADAIQGGRFEYEDFLKVIEGSQGQVEQTFSDISDPIDDVKVAMQDLTLQGSKLGGELLKTSAPMITELTDKIKELTAWFDGLSEGQKELVVKTGLLVAALGPLLMVVGQIATGIGGIMTMVSTIGPAIGALAAAGGPILLAVAAVGALAAVIYDTKQKADDYYHSLADLSDSEQENKQKVDDLKASYEELAKKRQESLGDIDSEAQHESDLWTELKNITDENGKIKDGQEARAKFITGELSKALGIEIDITGNQIQGYKDLATQIDTVIEKKRQEATLAAFEDEYRQALKDKASAQDAYTQALSDSKTAADKYSVAAADMADKQEALNEALRNFDEDDTSAEGKLNDATLAFQKARDAAVPLKDHLDQVNQTLADSEAAWVGVNTTIQDYEGANTAIISGDQESINQSLLELTSGFQTCETGTKESLERQVQTLTEKYQAMKAAVDSGAPGVTQTQVDQMKDLVDKSKQELSRLPAAVGDAADSSVQSLSGKSADYKAAGEQVGGDYSAGQAQGILAGQPDIEDAAKTVSDAGTDASKDTLGIQSPSKVTHEIGTYFSAGLAEGITEGTSQVTDAVGQVASAATSALSNQLQQSNMATQTYQSSMGASWSTWATTLVSTINVSLANIGLDVDAQLGAVGSSFARETTTISTDWNIKWTAIKNKHKDIMKDIQTLTSTVLSAIKTLNQTEVAAIKEDSITSMEQMVEGIDAELKKLEPTVRDGYEPAIKYIKDLIPQARIWANDMMDGYIQGIREKIRELEAACRDVADTVSDYVHFTRPEKGPLRDYEEWMPHMMQGLAKGIENNRGLIVEQMRGLAADMAALQVNGQQAKQTVNLTSYNVIALDGKQVAEAVNEQLGVLL